MKKKKIIGVSSKVDFTSYKALKSIPARIDTGARTSSLWVSNVRHEDGSVVSFHMFGPSSPYYTGKRIKLPIEGVRTVTSSTGHTEERLIVKLSIVISKRKLSAKFTLSNRASQIYPILIGRNTLRGNFLVDSADPGEVPLYKDPSEEQEYKEGEDL